MKKILITSTQYPYYGGASSNAYALIKYFRTFGYRVGGLFFEKNNVNVDPDNIGGIWQVKNDDSSKIVLKIINTYFDGKPDIILAKNYGAPLQSKAMFYNVPVIYMVTGSPHMVNLSANKISAIKYLNSSEFKVHDAEIKCVKNVDIIIPNSPLGKKLLNKHYGAISKIKDPIDTSFALNNVTTPIAFKKRKYSLAFIASNVNRTVKNAELARNIFMKFPNLNKIVVGENSNIFSGIKHTSIFPSLDNKKIMSILANTKLSLCTSYYDASPNIIKESLLNNTNILLSKNCGWSELYPSKFVCEDVYNLDEWIGKASELINNDIDFNLNSIKRTDSIKTSLERYFE